MEYKSFKFDEVKSVTDEGIIEGILSPYNNVDLGKDIVRPGAFKRTLNAQKGRIPALLDHDFSQRIGVHYLEDTPKGLATTLHLNMDKQIAKDALSDVKFWHKNGLSFGLSIGYDTIQKEYKGEIRELLEVQLWEGSLTAFPMNLEARTSSAKDIAGLLSELKSGRVVSASNRRKLEQIQQDISALLAADEPSEPAGSPDDSPKSALVEQLKSLTEETSWIRK